MRKKGFTLIELLVVIAIIGILSSIVLVSLGGARSKARDAQRQSDMRQVVTAQEMYYGENDQYYTSGDAAGTSTLPAIGTYLAAIDDPSAGRDYTWLNNNYSITGCTIGQYFCAYASLENKGTCTTIKYFAASEKGTTEICDTAPTYGGAECACW